MLFGGLKIPSIMVLKDFFTWGQNYDEILKLFDYVLNVNESIQVENVNDVEDEDLPIMMHNLKWLMKLECK